MDNKQKNISKTLTFLSFLDIYEPRIEKIVIINDEEYYEMIINNSYGDDMKYVKRNSFTCTCSYTKMSRCVKHYPNIKNK
jgi:hypothetical protein